VQICPDCGEENPPRFRLCGFCGAQLTVALPAQERRKTVTIFFSDLKGSTNLGEKLDSESLREVIGRYFDEMRAILEDHGGRVEKYIGDAIMAVFGLPRVHEDDALRAVRAALATKEALAALNEELQRRWGVQLQNRTGVNTGEVVAGDPTQGQRLVTGDVVNVAARLEQAAPALEILIGEPTYRLVRHAVDVEPVDPLELKGKSERVPAYRLLAAHEAELSERAAMPLVGREQELVALDRAFRASRDEPSCRIVTVLGEAGVGKSRLTDAFVDAAVGTAQVLTGRCLPYGRGITFWPLAEIARAAAEIREDDSTEVALSKLARLAGPEGDEVAHRVASAIGLSEQQFPLDELFWGTRKLFETLASRGPLVLVFEDIHWAESTLLDLIDHLVSSTSNVPVFILCLARHELLEQRPQWGSGACAATLSLEPLSRDDASRIVDNLLGRVGIDEHVRERIVEAADGNPLFVEQLLSMMIDEGVVQRTDAGWVAVAEVGDIAVPPTINALLAARLDGLGPEERAVIDAASVIGLVFAGSAVHELVADPIKDRVEALLDSLAGKQLVRSDRVLLDGEDAFRFQHILIRDAVYHALLKRNRATLHERFVDWGERVNRSRDRTEYEEILGYHLEQAYSFLSELGPLDDHGRKLGVRAFAKLSATGRRAFGRGDMPAAANLLRRAAELLPADDLRRLELLPDLGEAFMETGEFAWARVYLEQAIDGVGPQEGVISARARLVSALVHAYAASDAASTAGIVDEADRAIPIFEQQSDHAGLALAYRSLAWAHGTACRFGEAAVAAQRAVEHATLANDERQRTRAASQYAIAALHGPTPVGEAIAYCKEIIERASGDRRSEGLITSLLAPLMAMIGEFDQARDLSRRGKLILEDLGRSVLAASTSQESSVVEMLAQRPDVAEHQLRSDFETLTEMGERYLLSTIAGELARAVYAQGRLDEALELTRAAEELSDEDDVVSQAYWRSVRARVLARSGQLDDGMRLAREAVTILSATDILARRAEALIDLAEILELAGRGADARAALDDAIALLDQKEHHVGLERARAALARVGEPTPAQG
jgi:class 3 adenylate cyclase/tetratricopeptide (TPR) repeat protein